MECLCLFLCHQQKQVTLHFFWPPVAAMPWLMEGKDVDNAKTADEPPPPRPEAGNGKVEAQPFRDLAPLTHSFRPSSDDAGSTYSADNENERQRGRPLDSTFLRYQSVSPAPPRSWRAKGNALWTANKGLVLVLVSQLFGALMNVTTRLLETSEAPLNSFQVRRRRL